MSLEGGKQNEMFIREAFSSKKLIKNMKSFQGHSLKCA